MFLLFLTLSILTYMINGYIGLLFQLVSFCYYKNKFYKNFNMHNVDTTLSLLIELTIISIPTSFINIFGGSYGSIPISFFNLFIGFIILYIFYQRKNICFDFNIISKIAILFCIYLVVSIAVSINKFSAFKDYLSIVVPLIAFILIISIKKININIEMLENLYIEIGLITSLVLLIQIIFSKVFNYDIGMIGYFSDNRTAYGIIFSDYSFLSLFLTTSSAMYIPKIINKKNIKDILRFIIITLASILTTSRTGVAGLIGGAILYLAYKIIVDNNIDKNKYYKLLPYIIALALVSVFLISKLRPEQSIFSGSGRIKEYIVGLKIFLSNPILGIGLGTENYMNYIRNILEISEKMTIPHNFFILTLVQTGIIGATLICLTIYKVLKLLFIKKNDILLISVFTTIVGCQFIPDILQSRFFIIQLILIFISYKFKECKSV